MSQHAISSQPDLPAQAPTRRQADIGCGRVQRLRPWWELSSLRARFEAKTHGQPCWVLTPGQVIDSAVASAVQCAAHAFNLAEALA